MFRRNLLSLAALACLATPLAWAQGKELKIAHIYSKTGPLEAYGKQTQVGLMMGLEYATGGTMQVAGRKIVVIDRTVGYIGSHNLAAKDFKVKEKYAPWIDATMRVSGAAVNDLQKIFVEDWFLETDEDLWMLVGQGVLGVGYWTGQDRPTVAAEADMAAVMRRALEEAAGRRR